MTNKFFCVLMTLTLTCSLMANASESMDFFSDIKNKVSGLFSNKSTDENLSKSESRKEESPSKNQIKFSDKVFSKKLLDERRIYLIDLTRSMEGYNGSENIFGTVKSQLSSAISEITDTTTEVILIPFTDRPFESFIGKISRRDEILNYISELKPKHGDTNILAAWSKGVEYLDDSKINYLFMLTDGVHNYGPPIEDLYQALNEWHNQTNGKYEFAFYVLLTPNAKEKEICRIVESSKQMWLVPTLNINTDFIVGKMNLSVNIKDNNRVSIPLTCTDPNIFNNGFKFNLSMPENEYYKIADCNGVINENGLVTFTFVKRRPQIDLPVTYNTKIQIDYDKEKYPFIFFTPEEYNIKIENVGIRSMTVKKLKK